MTFDELDLFETMVDLAAEDAFKQQNLDLRISDIGDDSLPTYRDNLAWAVDAFKNGMGQVRRGENFTPDRAFAFGEACFTIAAFAADLKFHARTGGAEGGKKSGVSRRKKPGYIRARSHALELAKC